MSRINRNIWTVKPYVYKSTSSGVGIYDVDTSVLVNFIPVSGGSNSVWANNEYLYSATTSGIYRCTVSGIELETILYTYKSYPELTANNVLYLHGKGDYLCSVTESGVDRYNTKSDSRYYITTDIAEKCFQTSDGCFYYYENSNIDTDVVDHNFINWKYVKKIVIDPSFDYSKSLSIEIPSEPPFDIQVYSESFDEIVGLLSFSSSSQITVSNFWSSALSGRYNGSNFQGKCTVMMWVKPTTLSTSKRILVSDAGGSGESEISFYSNRIYCIWASGNEITYSSSINTNRWYHVAITHEDDISNNLFRFKLYVDGVLVGETSRSLSGAASTYGPDGDLRLGNSYLGVVRGFKIFNKNLNLDEIRRASVLEYESYEDLVLYYKLDTGSGNIAYDFKGVYNSTISSPSWSTSTATVPNLLVTDGNCKVINSVSILKYERAQPIILEVLPDLGTDTIYLLYGNGFHKNISSLNFLVDDTYETFIPDDGEFYDLYDSKYFENEFDMCSLYAVYNESTQYKYSSGKKKIIRSLNINDIHITEDTSINKPGNVMFLATSYGAYVIEEKRGDEDNCRKRVYLKSS